ncbi:hypothetical protein LIER_34721 [Lithospermum erythrorhizon]|uniref:Uncharacterized protein n=1 Tax=Lithospermum erythrorhizon TaxID=34254 RepID=A0AAV3S231_LITER
MQTREPKKNVVNDNNVRSSIRKRRTPAGQGGSQIKNAAKVVEKDATQGTSIILSPECKKSSGLRARKAGLNYDEERMELEVDQKKQPNDLSIHEIESPGGQKTHRRKGGRPQKVLVGNAISAVTECIAEMSFSNGEGSDSQHETQISKKANRRTSSGKESSQTQDTTTVNMPESVCITKEAKIGFKQGGCNMSEDQPLSKWVEEIQFAGSLAVAKQHTDSMTMKELIKQTPDNNNGIVIAGDEVANKDPAVGSTETSMALFEPELSFKKNTSLWVVVESMEVFRKMPQKPHFRPLLSFKESSREGFALACMVNFCSAVESISKLQFDDPKEKMDDILDTLIDLESHGFSVQVLRDRMSELVSIKENHAQLCAQVDNMNKEVILSFLDKYEQDNEINEINEEMKKLQERIANAESIKEIKDGEIAGLESRRQDLEDAMRRTRSLFEDFAAAL